MNTTPEYVIVERNRKNRLSYWNDELGSFVEDIEKATVYWSMLQAAAKMELKIFDSNPYFGDTSHCFIGAKHRF